MNGFPHSARLLDHGEQIAHALRVEIIAGVIPDGEHLTEESLAARFDASRGPIREALRQLVAEGLVENRRKRLYARALTMADVDELVTLREALETLALRWAVQKATDADWDALQAQVDRMRAAADEGARDAFDRADLEFHTAFYLLSGHRRLTEAWRPYERTFEVLFGMSNQNDMAGSIRDHERFLDTARRGDVEAALDWLHVHVTTGEPHIRDFIRTRDAAAATAAR